MKIMVNYCGGCNPYYDRVMFIDQLIKAMPSDWVWEYIREEEIDTDDVVLLVQGCFKKCNNADWVEKENILSVDEFTNMTELVEKLTKLANKTKR